MTRPRRRRRSVDVPGLGKLAYDPKQPCGLPFEKFRTHLRFADAYEWIAWRKNEHGEDLPGRPSAKAIVRQLSRAKAWLYQEYLAACEPFRVSEASRPGCGPVCHPKRSQPCGKACIPLDARCKTPPDDACSFEDAYGAFEAPPPRDEDDDDGWTAEDFRDEEPFTLFGLGSGDARACPAFRFETQDRGDHVLVRAYSPVDGTISGTLRADRVNGALQVKAAAVEPDAQRCRVGTRLYEEVARVGCAEGLEVRSDRRRSGYSEAFWRKQAAKGRARCNPGTGINLSHKDRRTPKEIRGKTPYWPCATWTLEAPCDATRTGLGKTSKSSCPHAKRFGELVNMTPAEIRAWSKDPRSKLASWASTRARLPALATLKAKPVAQWTEADCKFAARVVSFNSRMDGMRKEHGCTTKIDVSLRNWGRRAPGCKLPKKP